MLPLAVDVAACTRFPKLGTFWSGQLQTRCPHQGSLSSAQLEATQVKAAAAQESSRQWKRATSGFVSDNVIVIGSVVPSAAVTFLFGARRRARGGGGGPCM